MLKKAKQRFYNTSPFDNLEAVIGDADKSWRPGREIWNQYSYNITNILSMV